MEMLFGGYWWLAIPGLLLGLYAQMKLMSTYSKYVQVPSERGISGARAARIILDQAGLHQMPVHETPGQLTDHYDPIKKALFLSHHNFHGSSLAALGVAAHEAGHALQHKAAYHFFKLRMAMVPVTRFASMAYLPLFLIGMFAGGEMFYKLLNIIIGVFLVIVLFQVVTLPVEYDASRRAKAQLAALGLVTGREQPAVSKVLNAAALTYVAAMVTAILTLLRLILIARAGHRE
jgi:uncharacterized protein